MGEHHSAEYLKYSTVTGYFLQDDPSTDAKTFDCLTSNLGLIDQPYDTDSTFKESNASPWHRFGHKLQSLNQEAPSGTRYVLVYLGRHGEGVHNAAETKYGTHDWDCHWASLDGDGEVIWADAHLTEEGKAQALAVNAYWKKGVDQKSVLLPERFIISPLDRCIRTAELTWLGLEIPQYPFKPLVKEMIRETIGIHTCDRRSSKTYIQSHYPYEIEAGFTEGDELWLPDLRESDQATAVRLKGLLDDVVQHSDASIFSFTAHSGAAAGLLRAVNHRPFRLEPAAVIPLLIKVERVKGEEPKVPVDPWLPKPKC